MGVKVFEGLNYLPMEIKNDIIRTCGGGNYQEKPNTYSLTNVLGCLRQAYYQKTLPRPPETVQSCYAKYRGILFDEKWTRLFRHNQVRCTYRCKSIPITISGKYDFITNTDPPVLTDLKTREKLESLTSPIYSHIKQVRFYAYCNSIHHAQLIYVNLETCKVFPIEVGNVQPLLDEIEERAYRLYMAFLTNTIPPMEESGLCSYCNYQTTCNPPKLQKEKEKQAQEALRV